MKKLLTVVLTLTFVFAMSLSALAGCGDPTRSANDKYVKNLTALAYESGLSFSDAVETCGYSFHEYNIVGGEASRSTDLNKGVSGSSYIRLLMTFSPVAVDQFGTSAITDIVAVYKRPSETPNPTVTRNGVTYYSVDGKYAYMTGLTTAQAFDRNTFDFNMRPGDEADESEYNVYLYITWESKAGDPITNLDVVMGEEHRNDAGLVKTVDGESCDLNKGYGGEFIYIKVYRDSGNSGSVFDTTSVVFICVSVAVVLGVVGFVLFRKKKGTAQ